jgi:hypothetical protein
MLEEIQTRVVAGSAATIVLVEGLSDCFAVEAAAKRRGRDLDRDGIAGLPMGGITNVGRFLAAFGPGGRNLRLAGLCDVGEAEWLRARLDQAGLHAGSFFVCDRDLEDELIRSLGSDAVVAIIDGEGELGSLRRMQQMPAHRERSVEQSLHRFMGARSARKYRYARLLAEALDADALPAPLRDLLAIV